MAWGSFALLFALLSGVAAGPHIKKEMVESSERHNRYYHYEELRERLRSLAEAYPRQAQLFSIGQSVQGRELWVLRITAELHAQIPDRPQVKYVGNMHGDEAVSRQVLLYLADYLLRGYLRDPRLTRLLNTTDIYILPSLNPDGFENASEGDCTGNRGGRENARGRDLNRSFPDQFSPDSHPDLSEVPEVSAMINWIQSNRFLLSGNLHGGSVVASYPYDDSPSHTISGFYSKSSDDEVFKYLARAYSAKHPIMQSGVPNCEHDMEETFKDGITNGAQWYDVQDGPSKAGLRYFQRRAVLMGKKTILKLWIQEEKPTAQVWRAYMISLSALERRAVQDLATPKGEKYLQCWLPFLDTLTPQARSRVLNG